MLGAAVFPFFLYVVVATAGFVSCGDQCPDLIINRELPRRDLMMGIAKISLFMMLIVGVILRINTTNSTIESLIRQLTSNEDKREYSFSSIEKDSGQLNNLDQSSVELTSSNYIDTTPSEKPPPTKPRSLLVIPRLFLIAVIPAFVAVLVRNFLVVYLESAVGFLAPLFIIVFPCSLG